VYRECELVYACACLCVHALFLVLLYSSHLKPGTELTPLLNHKNIPVAPRLNVRKIRGGVV